MTHNHLIRGYWGYGDSLLIRPLPGDELHVHGLDGLRVGDASVMPGPTPRRSVIAEKGAAIIKGAAQQRLAA